MVESTAYFEAYRYVLEGLQDQEEEDLPFQRYECVYLIVFCRYFRFCCQGQSYGLIPRHFQSTFTQIFQRAAGRETRQNKLSNHTLNCRDLIISVGYSHKAITHGDLKGSIICCTPNALHRYHKVMYMTHFVGHLSL